MISSKSDYDLAEKSQNSRSISDDRASTSKGTSGDNLDGFWKSTPDWSISAKSRIHYWVETSLSGDMCYLSDQDCERGGPKRKCAACKIVIHVSCLSKMKVLCRPTFREANVRDYRDDKKKENMLLHHWVHRKRQDGRCQQCLKSFQSKLLFNNKDIVAIQCSWCKCTYHNKSVCFAPSIVTEECSRGRHCDSIIPPTWIIKMPTKNTFKSSVRKPRSPESGPRIPLTHKTNTTSAASNLETVCDEGHQDNFDNLRHISMTKSISLQNTSILLNTIPFVIKPIPNSPPTKPLLVFINPKSGGNDGMRLLRQFQWLLNPRQVFDISDGGPRLGLELFGRIPSLRILVCGGDGTAGWVMSEIDNLKISPSPPIAILPLGTGNDLARTSNWGGSYKDEPLSKIISIIEEGIIRPLDRWNVNSQLYIPEIVDNKDPPSSVHLETIPVHSASLPLNVFNNYFSLGADAATALEFHESREANPEKFNSRIKNKMFYAGIGGREMIKGSWKDLSDHVSLICDNIDYTQRIKEMKPHLLLFLNIPRYCAGTLPWGNPSTGYEPQSFNDSKLEVMGLTSASLATLHVGGHAERICQCSSAVITTIKTIPMQVDGEPCRLLPSQIEISLRNKAQIILRTKRRTSIPVISDEEGNSMPDVDQSLAISVFVIPLIDYEENAMDKNKLLEAARFYGVLTDKTGSQLSTVRKNLLKLQSESLQLDEDFVFLDSTTSDRVFRIGRNQEETYFLMDISVEDLYVLDPRMPSNLATENGVQSFYDADSFKDKDFTNSKDVSSTITNHDCTVFEKTLIIKADDSDCDRYSDFNGDNKGRPESDDINNFKEITEPTYNGNKSAETYDVKIARNTSESDSQDYSLKPYQNAKELNKCFLTACTKSQIDKVEKYILDGADFLSVDTQGLSALHLATIHGHIGVVHYLINNAPKSLLALKSFENGRTALHTAAELGRQSICSLLISAGASLLVKDNEGKTASQLVADPLLLQFLQSKIPSNSVL